MSVQDYHDAFTYEIFIRRAFKYGQGHSRIGYWNDKFDKVYKKVELAIDKFLSRRINSEEREGLLAIKLKLRTAYSKETLLTIIKEATEVTQRHKDYIER